MSVMEHTVTYLFQRDDQLKRNVFVDVRVVLMKLNKNLLE